MKKRILLCCFGVFLFSLGSSLCNICNFGVDPWTALNTGIAHLTGLSTGNCSIIMQAVLAVVIFFSAKDYLQIGTLINILEFGIVFDRCNQCLNKISFFRTLTLSETFLFFLLGVVLFTLGLSVYSSGRLGLSPYDATSRTLCRYFHISYSIARILTDGLCILIAFLFGGAVGSGTIIIVLCAGPFIQFWDMVIASRFVRTQEIAGN